MFRRLMPLLMTVYLAACQTAETRANRAGKTLGEVAALGSSATHPPLPSDCRKRERSGVRLGDPLDTALIKTDQALGRANARVKRCADWDDRFRAELKRGGRK